MYYITQGTHLVSCCQHFPNHKLPTVWCIPYQASTASIPQGEKPKNSWIQPEKKGVPI